MPAVFPFRAIQYKQGQGDVSDLIAPPYDVLDGTSKQKLLAKDRPNVVAIDLPHVPAKELGPQETYQAAGSMFHEWLESGVLSKRVRPAIFAYRQTFQFASGTHRRVGVACTVETVAFGPRAGGGILPHEETFSGPKEDRFALMKAARAQFSPIFGLHPDEKGAAVGLTRTVMEQRKADMTARMTDGVLHEVWTIEDEATIRAYTEALKGEDVFIADGHHRYTTGLNYLAHLESQGAVAADHPARRCMMVLVSMSDPGLVIGPTHRVLGGMKDYSFEKFTAACKGVLEISPASGDAHKIEADMNALAAKHPGVNVFGLHDFTSKKTYVAACSQADPIKAKFADKPLAWRTLDVAVIQYLLVEQIAQPKLNSGMPVKWAFPHSVEEILEIGRGVETGAGGGKGFAQLAIVVRPTPLQAVKDVSKANQLMPQKSTFFYPKLATGLFINALE